jgi:threonine/homoserine/homoserine lactone efflux protein
MDVDNPFLHGVSSAHRETLAKSMTVEAWSLYVATVLVLMSTPGPSQLLMLSNSIKNGFRRSVFTGLGDLTANFLQMLAAGLGLAALIASSFYALTIIKWLGVVYLVWLGWKMIEKAGDDYSAGQIPEEKPSLRSLWLQGFTTSAANPKAVVFFAALFPQFISPEAQFWPQFAILSATYIVIDACFLSAYGLGASWVAKRFRGNAKAWVERLGGSFIIGAAVLLGLRTATDR